MLEKYRYKNIAVLDKKWASNQGFSFHTQKHKNLDYEIKISFDFTLY